MRWLQRMLMLLGMGFVAVGDVNVGFTGSRLQLSLPPPLAGPQMPVSDSLGGLVVLAVLLLAWALRDRQRPKASTGKVVTRCHDGALPTPRWDPTKVWQRPAPLQTHQLPKQPADGEFHRGDIVTLGPGVPSEFRSSAAVVTKVAPTYCTVAVLSRDPFEPGAISGPPAIAVGECWPSFKDLTLVNSLGRLGNRVVVRGLKGQHNRHLNGTMGTVVANPGQEHPCFVMKASMQLPVLALGVGLDISAKGSQPPSRNERPKRVVLEARFLEACDPNLTQALDELTALLRTKAWEAHDAEPGCISEPLMDMEDCIE